MMKPCPDRCDSKPSVLLMLYKGFNITTEENLLDVALTKAGIENEKRNSQRRNYPLRVLGLWFILHL